MYSVVPTNKNIYTAYKKNEKKLHALLKKELAQIYNEKQVHTQTWNFHHALADKITGMSKEMCLLKPVR